MSNLHSNIHPQALKDQLDMAKRQGLSDSAILKHWLHREEVPFVLNGSNAALRNAILVGIDVEWWEHDDSHITEIGVSILDPCFVLDRSSAWTVLKFSINHHVRIKSTAHMVNSDFCAGFPEKFQFGKTTFVDIDEAKDMLRHSFLRFDARGQPRPTIFVGHAVQNDVKMIKERFGLDIAALGAVVGTIDTQVLAVENCICPVGKKSKLSQLLQKFYINEPYLHNGGNDVVCTMITTLLTLFPYVPDSNSVAYEALKKHLQTSGKIAYGSEVFCITCASSRHTAEYCRAIVRSEHCASTPKRSTMANSHKTEKCLEVMKTAARASSESSGSSSVSLRYPLPCAYCIESTDPNRHELEFAYGHREAECVYKS
ncbi:hypothetical protein BKA63DRAFT_420863 [Paraphoma chrysanthemicola]|nr:hypothetical protein BKA63DRAFT_420863 [Paraphoma chrysanthemicola]